MKIVKWWARGRAAALPPARRLAPVGVGPPVPLRMPAVAHAGQHDPVPQPGAVLARRLKALRARDRHRVRRARARHPALLHRPQEFEHGVAAAPLMRQYGCDRDVKTPANASRSSPRSRTAGSRWPAASTRRPTSQGDAHKFTVELARLAAARGVRFRHGIHVESLRRRARRSPACACSTRRTCPRTSTPTATSLALGSYTPLSSRRSASLQRLPGEGLLGDDQRRRAQRRADRVAHRLDGRS